MYTISVNLNGKVLYNKPIYKISKTNKFLTLV